MFHTRTPRSLITVAALATIAVAAPPASAQDYVAIDYNPSTDVCTIYPTDPTDHSEPFTMSAYDAGMLIVAHQQLRPEYEKIIQQGGGNLPSTGEYVSVQEAEKAIADFEYMLPVLGKCGLREDYNLAAIVGDGGNNNPDPYVDPNYSDPNYSDPAHNAGATDTEFTELTEDETIGMVIGLIFLVMIIGGILSALSGVIPGLTISF